MKVILFAVFAFAASTLATPIVAERQLDSQADELDSLIAQVQGYTANISKFPRQETGVPQHATSY